MYSEYYSTSKRLSGELILKHTSGEAFYPIFFLQITRENIDLVLDDVPESRLSGSSVATYSSLTSSETNSPMSYSEYSIDEDEQQSASPPHVGSRRLPRVRSTPTYANMHSIVDEDDYDSR